ncbi:hypothetical protein ACFX46_29350, partial [Streptomyces sp. YIM B13502]
MPTRRELGMHEMWCGADTSGEPVWHVLTPDKTSTLCGVEKEEESPRRDTTSRSEWARPTISPRTVTRRPPEPS